MPMSSNSKRKDMAKLNCFCFMKIQTLVLIFSHLVCSHLTFLNSCQNFLSFSSRETNPFVSSPETQIYGC